MTKEQNVKTPSKTKTVKAKNAQSVKKAEPKTIDQKIEEVFDNVQEKVQAKALEKTDGKAAKDINEKALKRSDEISDKEVLEKNKKTKKKKSSKEKKDTKNKETDKATIEDESFITRLQKKKKVNNKESLSVTLGEELNNIIKEVHKITGEKPNSIINHILSEIYDEKNKAFKVDILAETKPDDKVTSFLIEEKHLKAIKKTAKKLNMSSVTYFNKLILKYAQENILPDIDKNK